jgi:hypothetical protein
VADPKSPASTSDDAATGASSRRGNDAGRYGATRPRGLIGTFVDTATGLLSGLAR